jgi:hypothetical protein
LACGRYHNKPPSHLFLSSCLVLSSHLSFSLRTTKRPPIQRFEHKGGEERKNVPTIEESSCPLSLTNKPLVVRGLGSWTRLEQDHATSKMLAESERWEGAFGARAFPPKRELVEFRTRNFSAGRQAGQSAAAADRAGGASGGVKKPRQHLRSSNRTSESNERLELEQDERNRARSGGSVR